MKLRFIFLFALFLVLSYLVLSLGEVDVSVLDLFLGKDFSRIESAVFYKLRLGKFLTACFAALALSISGLFLQSFFKNPLAGPYVLGIHSGASLFVAIYLVLLDELDLGGYSLSSSLGTVAASILGSFLVLMILLFLSKRFTSKSVLLLFGLLISYISGGLLNILFSISSAGQIRDHVFWSFGSFNRLYSGDLYLFIILITCLILFALPQIKRMNILALGDYQAQELGVSLKSSRTNLIILSSCLSGLVTAFCGPIAFLGIMSPHVAKFIFKSSDHKIIFPGCLLVGVCFALIAEILSSGFKGMSIPLNSSLGLLGAPVIFIFFFQKMRGASL